MVFEWVTKEDEEITDDDNGDDDVFKIKGNTLLHWEDCQITQRRRYLLWALNGEMKQKSVLGKKFYFEEKMVYKWRLLRSIVLLSQQWKWNIL